MSQQKQINRKHKLSQNFNNNRKFLVEQESQPLKSNENSLHYEHSMKQQQEIQQTNKCSWIILIFLFVSLLSAFYFYSSNIPQELTNVVQISASKIESEVSLESHTPGIIRYEPKTNSQQIIQQMLKENLKTKQNTNLKQISTGKEPTITTITAKGQPTPKAIDIQKQEKSQTKNIPPPTKPNDPKDTKEKVTRAPSPIAAGFTQEQKILAKNLRQKKLQMDQKKVYQHYEAKYNISSYKEIPFCIVVPTYNNRINDRYLHNIESIAGQNYSNYRVLIIDDASTDDTGIRVQWYLKVHNLNDKFSYKRNQKKLSAMPNLRYAAMNFCKSYEIFMVIDGDDQIIGKNVLKLFSANFQKTKSYFIYSNFLSSRDSIGYSRPFRDEVMQKNIYRKTPLLTSHLRAFYTKLFQLIKQEDLKTKEGQYFQAANDVAICIPSLEMSGKRVTYLHEITYFYNENTGLNNNMVLLKQQKSNDRYIRIKPSYNVIDKLFTDEEIKQGGLKFLAEQSNSGISSLQEPGPINKVAKKPN